MSTCPYPTAALESTIGYPTVEFEFIVGVQLWELEDRQLSSMAVAHTFLELILAVLVAVATGVFKAYK